MTLTNDIKTFLLLCHTLSGFKRASEKELDGALEEEHGFEVRWAAA